MPGTMLRGVYIYYFNSSISLKVALEVALLHFYFADEKKWGSEKLSKLLKVTQLFRGQAEVDLTSKLMGSH